MEVNHEFVLKKAVAMFNKLTGKKMTTREGGTFLDIYDLVAQHSQPAAPADEPAATVELTPWQKATLDTHGECAPEPDATPEAEPLKEIPTFIGREVEKAVKPQPVEHSPELVAVAESVGVEPAVLKQVAASESAEPQPGRAETKASQFTFSDYAPPPIRTRERAHIPGYDWQILVLDRDRNPENSYIMHYALKPKQAEFNEHYAHFDARTHYVHLNEKRGREWVSITDNFAPFFYKPAPTQREAAPRIVHEAKAPEPKPAGRDVSTPELSTPWAEPEKAFRIRYYSDVAGAVIYYYVNKKPSGSEMAYFHHTKCLAAVQARPAA
ncbi:hypothetical protein PQA73_gp45 [Erwinia phage Pavtok]|uniref:Uncharacterized protein n=1 Tax=Erwinia phage Pavtok TaxID=2267655 RepID=A0A345BM02_9CAUD|nr:hypothetical protein PQA73_gp45 [Erwinia phage Pavtok]AXF51473.1 hypothetical protein PAVTOK_45 [Erwinia phage Pavtok]